MFSISAYTFGGGYIVIPIMKKHFVTHNSVLSEEELYNIAAIAQSVPGVIAINIAILVGYKIEGLIGAIVSLIASIMPPIIILSIVSKSYDIFIQNQTLLAILKGMEAGVAAIIVEMVLSMSSLLLKEKTLLLKLLAPLTFINPISFKKSNDINPIISIGFSIILCISQITIWRVKNGNN